jgi:hypothetical protein
VCQRLDNRLNCAVGNIDRQTGPLGPVLHNDNVLAGSPRAEKFKMVPQLPRSLMTPVLSSESLASSEIGR